MAPRIPARPLRLGIAGARFYRRVGEKERGGRRWVEAGGFGSPAPPGYPVMRFGIRPADEPPTCAIGQVLRGPKIMTSFDTSPNLAPPSDDDLRIREFRRHLAETRPLQAKGRLTPSVYTPARRGRWWRPRRLPDRYPEFRGHHGKSRTHITRSQVRREVRPFRRFPDSRTF